MARSEGGSSAGTADLSAGSDLVVIYLALRARTLRGVLTILGCGHAYGIRQAPDRTACCGTKCSPGCLERWARRDPHAAWWRTFLTDVAGHAVPCDFLEGPGSETRTWIPGAEGGN